VTYQPRHAAVRRGRHAAPRRHPTVGVYLLVALLVVVVGGGVSSIAWAGTAAPGAVHRQLRGVRARTAVSRTVRPARPAAANWHHLR
jgi:hypothetical protein